MLVSSMKDDVVEQIWIHDGGQSPRRRSIPSETTGAPPPHASHVWFGGAHFFFFNNEFDRAQRPSDPASRSSHSTTAAWGVAVCANLLFFYQSPVIGRLEITYFQSILPVLSSNHHPPRCKLFPRCLRLYRCMQVLTDVYCYLFFWLDLLSRPSCCCSSIT